MHSGGSSKHARNYILIEAPTETAAVDRFVAYFGRHPGNVTCVCCGDDYVWADPVPTLFEATRYLIRSDPGTSLYAWIHLNCTVLPEVTVPKCPKVQITHRARHIQHLNE